MTLSTSAVAVCCCSDSSDRRCAAQLVEQPGILDGDDGLIGKGRHQLDLFRSKWLRHGFRYEDHPHDTSLAQERDAERGSVAANLLGVAPGIFQVRQHIGNVYHPASSAARPVTLPRSTGTIRVWK